MSGCILVIYGAILPLNKMTDELDTLADEWHGPGLMQKPYSGNGEAPWYVGVEVAAIRQYSWPETGCLDDVTLEPTKKQKAEAAAMLAKIPAELREHMTPLGRYIIPCP